jgi:hypothetical protein
MWPCDRKKMESTAVKIFRFICLTTLGLITFIGLISLPFMSTIAAALREPGDHQSRAPAIGSAIHTAPPMTPGNSALLAYDNFQRADRVFWGRTSDGHMWGGDANRNPGFVIVNRSGRVTRGHGVYNAILGDRISNAEVVLSGSLSSFQHNNIGSVLRWNDAKNWYKAYIDGARLVLARDVAGAITTLVAVPYHASATTSYSLRFRIQGSQLFARAWPVGQAEPRIWMVKATDTAIPSGFAGLRLVVLNGYEAIISAFTEVAVVAP